MIFLIQRNLSVRKRLRANNQIGRWKREEINPLLPTAGQKKKDRDVSRNILISSRYFNIFGIYFMIFLRNH